MLAELGADRERSTELAVKNEREMAEMNSHELIRAACAELEMRKNKEMQATLACNPRRVSKVWACGVCHKTTEGRNAFFSSAVMR
eukprot:6022293-Pleurochrysis_carterae.AAC.3